MAKSSSTFSRSDNMDMNIVNRIIDLNDITPNKDDYINIRN